MFLLASVCWTLLLHAASFLAVQQVAVEPGDLIVLLGGDSGARSMKSVELYLQGMAPRILVTGLEGGERQVQPYYLDWRVAYLGAQGVGRDAILTDSRSQNTWEEAQNTLRLMQERGWRRVIVVSDPPHLRRLRWVWGNAFRGTGINVTLAASKPFWWDAEHWWDNEISAKFVVMEYLKLAYYLVRHP